MLESGKTIDNTEVEDLFMKMENTMKGISSMIKLMEKENIITTMDQCIRETFRTIDHRDTELRHI